ncbi:MAG: HipA N-terminal domain-containing protein [Flavobacteriaceae bacterium]
MRSARILYKNEEAGVLKQLDDGSFVFQYHKDWVENLSKPAISLTLPKTIQRHHSPHLFPFFYNMLPEGTNKQTVCFHHRIDATDDFGILMATAQTDSIGAVRVQKIEKP